MVLPITPFIFIVPVPAFKVNVWLVSELESIFPLKSIVPSPAVASKVVFAVSNTSPLISISSVPAAFTAVVKSPPI